jgi:hypothetical protein
MKYLCLIYSDEKQIASWPEPEYNAAVAAYADFGKQIQKSGHLIAAERLQRTHTATTIRSRNGKVSTTDGPFAETKEQLGGFYLINARDLNEAIQVASKIPGTRWGSIEVRPVWEMNA